MAATAYDVAKEIFLWARGNAVRIAEVQTAYDAAGANPLRSGGHDMVTSATKNSVTMQKIIGLSEINRQKALRWALTWLESGMMPSKRTVGSMFRAL